MHLTTNLSLEIFALFMLTGIFSTLLLPETKNKTLEELSNEDQEGFVRGMSCLSLMLFGTHALILGTGHVELDEAGLVKQS